MRYFMSELFHVILSNLCTIKFIKCWTLSQDRYFVFKAGGSRLDVSGLNSFSYPVLDYQELLP